MLDSFCHEVGVNSPVLFVRANKHYHGYITEVLDDERCKCRPNFNWPNPNEAKDKEYIVKAKNVYLLIVRKK